MLTDHERDPAHPLPAPAEPVYRSGAGLLEHAARDPFPSWAGYLSGIVALVFLIGGVVLLINLNPAFASGKAGGTDTQIGAAVVPGGAPGQLSPDAQAGMQLIETLPCPTCHTIPGIPNATGQVGPNLAGVASRKMIAGGAVPNNGPDDLAKWITNPPGVKPGTAMPVEVGSLSSDQINQIVAYLETLQ